MSGKTTCAPVLRVNSGYYEESGYFLAKLNWPGRTQNANVPASPPLLFSMFNLNTVLTESLLSPAAT